MQLKIESHSPPLVGTSVTVKRGRKTRSYVVMTDIPDDFKVGSEVTLAGECWTVSKIKATEVHASIKRCSGGRAIAFTERGK